MTEHERERDTNGPERTRDTVRGRHPGDRYVRVIRSSDLPSSTESQRYYVAPPTVPATAAGRLFERLQRALIGDPLTSAHAIHERLSKSKALAVFSSDALSSTAYATEEIMLILVVAGAAAFNVLVPIGLAIALLLAIVVFSYRQTIHAYPLGGGSYIVTKDNMGRRPSLLAASALLTGYILTVAVSISAGVAAITSASETLYPYRIWIAVAAVVLMMLANLRGVRESGTIFAVPTYLFIGSMALLLLVGLAAWSGIGLTPHPVEHTLPLTATSLTAIIVLRAFAAGCAALTGVEAIADGVPAFKEPQARNAGQTLVWMGVILGTLFLGVTILAHHFHLVPVEDETLVSQLTRTIVGRSVFYYLIQAATAAILVLGANTAFADFPRLSYFLARDGFMPRQFMARGDRLAFFDRHRRPGRGGHGAGGGLQSGSLGSDPALRGRRLRGLHHVAVEHDLALVALSAQPRADRRAAHQRDWGDGHRGCGADQHHHALPRRFLDGAGPLACHHHDHAADS